MGGGRRPPGRGGPSRDLVASCLGAFVLSTSLGMTTLALPLLALDAGYSGVEVGVLTAVAALGQVTVRLCLGAAMRRWSDWTLIATAGLLIFLSNVLVVLDTSLPTFVCAEFVFGLAGGCFWTGGLTHVVRGPGRAIGALAVFTVIGSLGQIVGPLWAGFLSEHNPRLALAVAGIVAVVGTIPSMFLDRLPPFLADSDQPARELLRQPVVRAGCWAGVTAGSWQALLGSYVPVTLQSAGHPASHIGSLVALSNAFSTVAAGATGRLPSQMVGTGLLRVAIVASGGGIALASWYAGHLWLAAMALALSGLGAGILQTLGPAVVVEAVGPQQHGDAMALTGLCRAVAKLVAPLSVAGLATVLALPMSVVAVGVSMALPVFTGGRMARRGRNPYGSQEP